MTDLDVLIIGGGISGLSIANWLRDSHLNIEVWEKNHRFGGMIATQHKQGYQTEQAASILMNYRKEVNQFLKASTLENAILQKTPHANSRRYLIHQGKLTLAPMTLAHFLNTPIWSLKGKLRLLAEPFIGKNNHTDETVSNFIKRRLGPEFLEKAIEPFVAGTLASDPDLANACEVLPRLKKLEKKYGSLVVGALYHKIIRKKTAAKMDSFSFKGGMSTLINAITEHPGIAVKNNIQVNEITPIGQHAWRVYAQTPEGERIITARKVVLSTPAYITAELIRLLNPDLANLLKGIQYAPLTVVHMGFDQAAIPHSLDSSGFLVPRQENMNITGNLWMSALFPERAPIGKCLLTSYIGGSRNPQVRQWDHQQCRQRVLDDLDKLLQIKDNPEMCQLHRHAKALPVYHGHYHDKLASIQTELNRHPGLFLEANYRGGVSVRDRIYRGYHVAQNIVSTLAVSQTEKKRTITPAYPLLNAGAICS